MRDKTATGLFEFELSCITELIELELLPAAIDLYGEELNGRVVVAATEMLSVHYDLDDDVHLQYIVTEDERLALNGVFQSLEVGNPLDEFELAEEDYKLGNLYNADRDDTWINVSLSPAYGEVDGQLDILLPAGSSTLYYPFPTRN